jgi:hypothetical protein
VLVCDLNNFARYPTISVGYLVAVLRRAGHKVELFSPWSVGIGGYTREPPVRPWGLIDHDCVCGPRFRHHRSSVGYAPSSGDASRNRTWRASPRDSKRISAPLSHAARTPY